MDTNVTRTLAEYIAGARYEDFPGVVVHKAKQLILDNIGCAFGGYATDNGKVLISFAREIGGKAESALVGDGTRVSCMVAAGTNAQMANILDFDDQSVAGHPGSAIVQTAISFGERTGASGKGVIEATVMGYEAINRIAGGAPPHTPRLRSTPNAIPVSLHVFGPAVAAAKILGLDLEQTKDAIGIAGAVAPTFNVRRLTDRPASPTKCANLWNCWTGISAALLARKGFHGPVDYLDGPRGYWALFSDDVDFGAMTADLGRRYHTAEIRPKPWATCGETHATIQLVTAIISDEGIRPGEIEAIKVKTHGYHASFPFDGQKPIEIWDAIFSIPWTIAMTVLGYETGPDWYAKERFQDPAALDLAARVRTEVLPEADKMFREKGARRMPACEVELTARGKTYIRRSAGGAKGDVDHPLTDEEFRCKFRSLAKKTLDQEQVEKVISIVDKLEDLASVKSLTRLYRPIRSHP